MTHPDGGIYYTARPNDYLVKIAQKHGTTWDAIWLHNLNRDHRRRRKSPGTLYAGDVLFIPGVVPPPFAIGDHGGNVHGAAGDCASNHHERGVAIPLEPGGLGGDPNLDLPAPLLSVQHERGEGAAYHLPARRRRS